MNNRGMFSCLVGNLKRGVSYIALAAGLALVVALAANSKAPTGQRSASGPSYTIGLLPFVDTSGSNYGGQLKNVLAKQLQAALLNGSSLTPRLVKLEGASADQSGVDITAAVNLGKSSGSDLVVMGSLLQSDVQEKSGGVSGPSFGGFGIGGRGKSQDATVVLQADVIDVGRGVKLTSLRASGKDHEGKISPNLNTNYGSMDMDSGDFQRTALGKATQNALNDLVAKLVSTATGFQPGAAAAPVPGGASAAGAQGIQTTVSTAASAQPAGAGAAGGQPDLKAAKIDFVPGERTVFYDDFSDAAEDEPPPHWKVRGDPIELRVGGGIRQLTNIGHSEFTSAPIDFPNSFTFEVDLKFPTKAISWPSADWELQTKDGRDAARFSTTARPDDHTLAIHAEDSKDNLGGMDVPNIDFNQPVHVAIWSQNGRFRCYVNGNRVVDVNATTVPTPSQIHVNFNRASAVAEVGIRRVRVAESTPDFATVIANTGKFVTHGINFDTDSDRLKPDSAPVLKQVVAGLEKNPNLRLEIDGYTDSVGDASHNLDLSKRRAQAVQAVLVAQFGIDASRLTANGFGAANPIGSNDTPDGRADNRRVEFIKK